MKWKFFLLTLASTTQLFGMDAAADIPAAFAALSINPDLPLCRGTDGIPFAPRAESPSVVVFFESKPLLLQGVKRKEFSSSRSENEQEVAASSSGKREKKS